METLPLSIASLQGLPVWLGRLQYQCWALGTQGWGGLRTKGRERGDLFSWERIGAGAELGG